MIRVAIADDHPEVRLALRLLLRLSEEMEVVCEAGDGEAAIACVRHQQPDVLVVDLKMPGLDGLAATKRIVELGVPTRVIVISLNRGNFFARQAEQAGASGFLAKDDLAAYLMPAIRAVHAGGRYFRE